MARTVGVVLAAGEGKRIGLGPKAFLSIGGRCILDLAAQGAAACPEIEALVIAVREGFEEQAGKVVEVSVPMTIVSGGTTRQESVRLALEAIDADVERVVCHDAARPFARAALFSSVLGALDEAEGAVPVVPLPDTVKRVRDGWVEETVPRDELRIVQTPQAFAASVLRDVHREAQRMGTTFTDDAAMLEWAGHRVRTVPGDPENFKITTPEDIARAERVALDGPTHTVRNRDRG